MLAPRRDTPPQPRQTMRLPPALPALLLSLCLALSSHVAGEEPLVPPANPMAPYARLIGGEWRTKFDGGARIFDTWRWGPGRHSIHLTTDGNGTEGEPWRVVGTHYWHPGRRELRLWGVSSYARSVSEGAIAFEGETAEARLSIFQTTGRRELVWRWRFDGPDRYHYALLEEVAPGELTPLTDWIRVRHDSAAPRPPAPDAAPAFPGRLKPLEPLLGDSWKAEGDWSDGAAFSAETTVEWVPYADAIYARVAGPNDEAESGESTEPKRLLDAYLYHHTGANELRVLALSLDGGVFEGKVSAVSALKGGAGAEALQFDLKGYEGERETSLKARVDFEEDGAARLRIWGVEGGERVETLDATSNRVP